LPAITLISAVTKNPAVETVFSHVRHGRIAALEKIFEQGLDINIKDDQGNSLLMVAAQNKNTTLVDILFRRGSRINKVNKNGNSAFYFALAYVTTGQLAKFLVEHGADDTIQNYLGLTE
jgi:ankyrin repeat protein